MTATQNCHNRLMRHNTPFRIYPNGKAYYVPKGFEIPADEFEKLFPIPLKVRVYNARWKGENPDGTKLWLEE